MQVKLWRRAVTENKQFPSDNLITHRYTSSSNENRQETIGDRLYASLLSNELDKQITKLCRLFTVPYCSV